MEAWEFIVGGGGSFNNLNGRFTARDPAGNTQDNAQILGTLRNLREFMYSFDFLKMSPDVNFVVGGLPTGVFCSGMSEPENSTLCITTIANTNPWRVQARMLCIRQTTPKIFC